MKKLTSLLQYLCIIACAALSAFSFHLFVLPNSFAPSGLNGIATMVQYAFDFKIGYLNLLINIPLLLIGFFVIGRRFALRSAAYTITFSVVILLLEKLDLSQLAYHTDNGTSIVLAPVAAGVIGGFVYGMVIKLSGCTGGTDIIAAFIHKRRPYLNLMWIIFSINALVAIISYFVYNLRPEPVLCCLIYSFVIGRVSTAIQQGGKEAVKFEVITDNAEELSERLIHDLHHSVTVIPAVGMYSHMGKQIILCIVNKHQVVSFQHILREFPGTFAYISTVRETLGNFKNIQPESLPKHPITTQQKDGCS